MISKEMVSQMFTKQSSSTSDGFYGYGIWIIDNPKENDFVFFQGCDPGVSFISEYNPNNKMISVLVSNFGDNVWHEMHKIRQKFY